MIDESQNLDHQNHQPESESLIQDFLPFLWYLFVDRIAPQTCCRYPPPMQRAFQTSIREVSKADGDLDRVMEYLHDIIADAPPDWMVFQQATELLNIIEWRRIYHPAWFPMGSRGRRLKPGKCAPYIARAMVQFQTGDDEKALFLTGKIINRSDPDSDDRWLAQLIRAAVLICMGEISSGEAEIHTIRSENPSG
jgi:hypothetical protein